jgi:acetyl esterase/lipase
MNEPTRFRLYEHAIDAAEQEQQRQVLERMRTEFQHPTDPLRTVYDRYVSSTPHAEGVRLEPSDAPVGVWVRPRTARPQAALLYLHGGGYVNGSARAFTGLVSHLAVQAELDAFVLDYPLAPEARFPAAFEAGIATLANLRAHGVRTVSLAGDSAGGGLSLALLAAVARGTAAPEVVAGVAFSAWVDLTLGGSSIDFDDPVLTAGVVQTCADLYAEPNMRTDPRVSPLFGVPAGLAPLYLQVGSNERLLDDSRRYARAAAEAGNEVRLDIWQGMHHVFQLSLAELPSGQRAVQLAAAFLRERHG